MRAATGRAVKAPMGPAIAPPARAAPKATPPFSGWVTFAGVMASIAGVYNLLSGIAAIADDARLSQYPGLADIDEVLYGVDLSTWGWFWAIVGGLQLVTAGLIFARNTAGQMLGSFSRPLAPC